MLPPSAFKTVTDVSVTSNSVGAKPARDEEEPQVEVDGEPPANIEQASERLSSYFPEWKTETLFLEGSPTREIIRQAREWNADLIVVGSHGHTQSKRFALGSVTQKIANEAACSVRVVRGQAWKNGSPSRLVIGLDGSDGVAAAVEEVARRMWTMGSEIRLVVAQDTAETKSAWLGEYIENVKKTLAHAEFTVTELIEKGDPKRIIAASAEEWGADCIFLGANNAGDLGEYHLLGGVATAIVARAHCTVEIVR